MLPGSLSNQWALLFSFGLLFFNTGLWSQEPIFTDIHEYVDNAQSSRIRLLYYHLVTCGPCKRMDREVLSDPEIRDYLSSNFELVSVYNLDSLTHVYRRKYNVSTNPCFLFLNQTGEVVHRLVGFIGKDEFWNECEKVRNGQGLSWMQSEFESGRRDPGFLAQYVAAMDKATLLDHSLVSEYFVSLSEKMMREPLHFSNLLRYGYYRRNQWVEYDSRVYRILKKSYHKNEFPEFREALRCRLLFSLYDHIRSLPQDAEIAALIEELINLENGEQIAIKDIDDGRYYRFIEERYPSYLLQYERLKRSGDRSGIEKLNQGYSGKPGFRPVKP